MGEHLLALLFGIMLGNTLYDLAVIARRAR